MKKIMGLFITVILILSLAACAANGTESSSTADNDTNQPSASSFNEAEESNTASEQTKNDTKILVVCFSATGNTKAVAEKIVEVTGADYFEIIPAEPYSEDDLNYNDDNCRANREQQDKNCKTVYFRQH